MNLNTLMLAIFFVPMALLVAGNVMEQLSA